MPISKLFKLSALAASVLAAGGGSPEPPPSSSYSLPAYSPLSPCAYPLDDNGTIAGAFGYASANVIGAALQRVDHTIVGTGVTGSTAIAIANDPFGTDAITRSGRQWVGFRVASITAALLANAEAQTWTGAGPAFVWGGGTAATTITARPSPGGTGATTLQFGGLGEGLAAYTRLITIPFDEISVGIYADHTAQKIGYTVNGIDQGFIDGPVITAGTTVTPYAFVNNSALTDLDGENVVFDFLTVPDEYMLAKGLTSICGQAIPNVLDYFGATPVNPLELTSTFAPHLALNGLPAVVTNPEAPASAQFGVTSQTIALGDRFLASEPIMRTLNWPAAEERSIYLKNPGTWSYQSLGGPLFTKTTPILKIWSDDGLASVSLYAAGNAASREAAVPKWILQASRVDSPSQFLQISVNDGAWTANELSTDNPVLTIDGNGFLHVYLDGSTEMTLAYATELGAGQPAEALFAPGSKLLFGGEISMPTTQTGSTLTEVGVTVSAQMGTDGGSLAPGMGQSDFYGNAL